MDRVKFWCKENENVAYHIYFLPVLYDGDDLHMREVAVDTDNPYIYTMARIKPFLISYKKKGGGGAWL
ncbi:MAG: hypothetical protein EOP48_29185 [Sphingobacteriales bacterium]|nr:MAG: hypothetical protein EOP48_29185 [Sphingobacteriales bacterium]